jgi:hypothetical protein
LIAVERRDSRQEENMSLIAGPALGAYHTEDERAAHRDAHERTNLEDDLAAFDPLPPRIVYRLRQLAQTIPLARAGGLLWGAGAAGAYDKPRLLERCSRLADLVVEADNLRAAKVYVPLADAEVPDLDVHQEAQVGDILRGLLTAKPKPRWRPSEPGTRLAAYGAKAISNSLHDVRNAPAGDRNNQLARAAYLFGRCVGADLIDEQTALDDLLGAACDCGLPEREARACIRSGVRAGGAKPLVLP